MIYKLFVYGSLKRGFGNHHFLEESKFVSKITTKISSFRMFSLGGFPGVSLQPNGRKIIGELYEIDDNTLQRIDYLEGNGNFYNRRLIKLDNGDTAWMYIIDQMYGEDDNFTFVNGLFNRIKTTDTTQEWLF